MIFWIAITVALVLGMTVASQEGMIFGKLRTWLEAKDKMWTKPVLTCVWCMASVWSLVAAAWLIAYGKEVDLKMLLEWPVVVCASSFISGTLWSLSVFIQSKM